MKPFLLERDEAKAKRSLSKTSWAKLSLELKVWWWFKRLILENEKRRKTIYSFNWIVNDDIKIPTKDGVDDGGELLSKKRWSLWMNICEHYQTQTIGSADYSVEWDVDTDGNVYGILLVAKRECTYQSIQSQMVLYSEYFGLSDYFSLKEAGLSSLFECFRSVEGDDLCYYFGVGALISHRCNFEVRFGEQSKNSAKFRIGTMAKGTISAAKLKCRSLCDVKKKWKLNEILCVCYSHRCRFRDTCRCKPCREKKRI
jgi:hypothetical protein